MLYVELETILVRTPPNPRGPSGFHALLAIAERGTPFTAPRRRAFLPPHPPRPIRLPRPPRHRRARHPLHCPRRTRLHLRSRPIRRPSHLPHPLPRLPSVLLRPMLLPLRHHPHHPR